MPGLLGLRHLSGLRDALAEDSALAAVLTALAFAVGYREWLTALRRVECQPIRPK